MGPGTFKSLMDDAACRSEALRSVGQQLRKRYDAKLDEPMPDTLRAQLQRLTAADRARRNLSDV